MSAVFYRGPTHSKKSKHPRSSSSMCEVRRCGTSTTGNESVITLDSAGSAWTYPEQNKTSTVHTSRKDLTTTSAYGRKRRAVHAFIFAHPRSSCLRFEAHHIFDEVLPTGPSAALSRYGMPDPDTHSEAHQDLLPGQTVPIPDAAYNN